MSALGDLREASFVFVSLSMDMVVAGLAACRDILPAVIEDDVCLVSAEYDATRR